MAKEFDLVILGGGTGGYVAAIRASQLGMSVAIVEKAELGGTCLHRGCIPSKALLRSAEVYKQTKSANEFGIETKATAVNFSKVQERKHSIITKLHQGVQGLMKKGKIEIYHGFGRILGPSIFSPMPGTISIEYSNGEENTMLIPKNVLIATGSSPKTLPGLEIDHEYIMTSDDALKMTALPESIIIVGGGVIGIEWASMLADFDVDVTVIEYLDHILPTEDLEVAKEVEKLLKKKGISFVKNAKVLADTIEKENGISVEAEVDGENQQFAADKMLVSVGRKPNTTNIGIENTDIIVENGSIQTNSYYQTKESHIYAIGDVIGGMQLAHVASHEGITAVEHMADKNPTPIDYNHVPSCIYSSPEAASVGLTEKQAIDQGYDVKIGKFPFQAVGKALVYGEADGFVKIIADKQTDDLLGIHMVGPHVTDMISEAGLAKVLDATPWEIADSIHPHPTLSEVIGEAALAVDGKQIHG
ncbi:MULTISPECIES: dihydrolipoyl dehydrogenase [Virgibacillus]|uniref:Dihydrolipoyl dehydrogenase n=2 Tax=Virgibacillus TaxID=84406 RepID=A0A024QBR5_9BACI|nr:MULTISPECIES: dihydrolipoyl dehydrogenase [Virgibacillus]EQB36023.1 dihydrolipoamide dehydrogenase [Virgibacillus sp. CM-4]MYL41887.1 dihydrolipoyl dehydrogenase [Virgibacillus massiliensis]GGJ47212.1 dihydrolipoyl dehydrogenase [Virgibacillus kapii]CDQ39717.1 Dihydrolipoyl dehydrogenase [Virgibacillus massiliensis]